MANLFGDGLNAVESALRFRLARQSVLAANVANADTPGYRPADLEFDAALAGAERRLARTDARHLGAGAGGVSEYRLQRADGAARLDGNGVDLDRALIELSRNAGAFNEQATVFSRLVAMKRAAIGEGAR